MSVEATIVELAQKARRAARRVAAATTEDKNRVLETIAANLEARKELIQAENA